MTDAPAGSKFLAAPRTEHDAVSAFAAWTGMSSGLLWTGILAIALCGLGLVWLWYRSEWRKARAGCRWRPTGTAATRTRKWICGQCGAEGFSTTGGPPQTCGRALRGRPL